MAVSPGRLKSDVTITCPDCQQGMLVAPEHFHTQVACPGCGTALNPWELAGKRHAANPAPPPALPAAGANTLPPHLLPPQRSRIVAGVLGIVLGPLGVHRFYLGYTGVGVAQLLLTFFTGIGALWGFIEGILCLTGHALLVDADGRPLRDR